MSRRLLLFCLTLAIYHSLSFGQLKDKYNTITESIDEDELSYNKNCQNTIYYDKRKDSIANNVFFFIYGKKKDIYNSILYESAGLILSGKKEGWWVLDYLKFDSNNNKIAKHEFYKNGFIENLKICVFYKETDSLLKILYQTNFKNGTGYYKDYNRYGKVIAEGNYKDGCKDKWWKYYNDKGYLIRKEKYNKGVLKKTLTYQPKE